MIHFDVIIEDDRWASFFEERDLTQCSEALQFYFPELEDEIIISVLACNDIKMAHLNESFRGKPTPTNVLSWPAYEFPERALGEKPIKITTMDFFDGEIGDIAISYETCFREAKEQSKAFIDHVTHLIVHGVLHLLGYDHVNDLDAELMESCEKKILERLCIADPYLAYNIKSD